MWIFTYDWRDAVSLSDVPGLLTTGLMACTVSRLLMLKLACLFAVLLHHLAHALIQSDASLCFSLFFSSYN